MRLTIFISYSTKNTNLVNTLYSYLRQKGFNVATSQSYNPSFKRSIDKQIESLIRKSNCVLAIFTNSDKERSLVFDEMAIGLNNGKLVIPIVEKGTFPALPPIYRYIIYDKENPWDTIQSARHYSEWLETSNYRDRVEGKLGMALAYLINSLSFFDAIQKKNMEGEKDYGAFT